ncbi:hypothetical protein V22_25780 [Calycomorphotria hydatis]|uniref:Uncharacterized protein n=1 Tax=Calycomorphotria hydatis TaxID=2528027 RepID=A0A517TAD4_9PLAN|nr:hypothetical protein V22_25780 [Calycomorphotria hydatis]
MKQTPTRSMLVKRGTERRTVELCTLSESERADPKKISPRTYANSRWKLPKLGYIKNGNAIAATMNTNVLIRLHPYKPSTKQDRIAALATLDHDAIVAPAPRHGDSDVGIHERGAVSGPALRRGKCRCDFRRDIVTEVRAAEHPLIFCLNIGGKAENDCEAKNAETELLQSTRFHRTTEVRVFGR